MTDQKPVHCYKCNQLATIDLDIAQRVCLFHATESALFGKYKDFLSTKRLVDNPIFYRDLILEIEFTRVTSDPFGNYPPKYKQEKFSIPLPKLFGKKQVTPMLSISDIPTLARLFCNESRGERLENLSTRVVDTSTVFSKLLPRDVTTSRQDSF